MKNPRIFSTALLISTASAAKFSLPLSETWTDLLQHNPSLFQGDDGGQKLLNGHQIFQKHPIFGPKSRGSVVELHPPLIYTTNISLGTPPQLFRAIIDLDWSDLFVPSIKCAGDHCSTKEKYDSSASSTFHENGTRSRLTYGPVFAYGILGSDTLALTDDLEIAGQQFHELRFYEMVYPDYGVEFFDSVLGLAIDSQAFVDPVTPNILPSPFKTMMASRVLDENLFAISFPRNKSDTGDLTFGGVNEEFFEGELISHPLSLQNTTNWQIHVESVSLSKGLDENDSNTAWENSSSGYTALMYSTYAGVVLPYSLAESVIGKIRPNQSHCKFSSVVNCNQNVTIIGEDYIYKWTPPEDACPDPIEECVLMIDSFPPPRGRDEEFPEDFVILGSSFLKKVYSVYNWDEQTISFGKLKD
ncbi:acid protease [Stipitochalara longipes BDJ]|nr:acid protease [Stipitochalara longipes BDJ]